MSDRCGDALLTTIHARRHTRGTRLSKKGVAPRTAQAAIQPSQPRTASAE